MGGTSPSRLVVAPKNLRGFRALTLDAFGSLLDGGPNDVPAVLARLLGDAGRPADGSVRDLWRTTLRTLFGAEPFIAYREVYRAAFQQVFEHFQISASVDESIDAAFDAYRHAKIYPDVRPALRLLEGEVAMAIVSNMETRLLLEALQNNDLSFDFVISSEEEQRYKPSATMFQRAVRYLGLPAANVLHVGDSYAEDVLGAKEVGMGSALMQRVDPAQPPPRGTTVVRDLREVRAILRRSWE